MPRASRTKAVRRHAVAVQLPSKRAFAVPDNQVTELILPGSGSAPVIPTTFEPRQEASTPRIRKADRPPASALVPPLPSHPYSRSHAKREKRKAREHLLGGELHSVAVALSEAIGETEALPLKGDHETTKRKRDEEKREESKIGIGKGRTLGEKARRKQISLQAKRIPAIMQHPRFKKDPWATIRLHASNAIVAKDPAGADQGKKAKLSGMEGVD